MATKRKDFKDMNPAFTFIDAMQDEGPIKERPQERQQDNERPPAGYKMNPLYIETKSKRVNVLLQPSLYERIRAAANAEGRSVNETITEAIKAYLDTKGEPEA